MTSQPDAHSWKANSFCHALTVERGPVEGGPALAVAHHHVGARLGGLHRVLLRGAFNLDLGREAGRNARARDTLRD